ncbi:MAG: hypothetical protein SV377_07010 [Halobacteria archaeon]|nr:hypothetical protein [Halobacteria archaeon]
MECELCDKEAWKGIDFLVISEGTRRTGFACKDHYEGLEDLVENNPDIMVVEKLSRYDIDQMKRQEEKQMDSEGQSG